MKPAKERELSPHLKITEVDFLKPAANLKQAEKVEAIIDAARLGITRHDDWE